MIAGVVIAVVLFVLVAAAVRYTRRAGRPARPVEPTVVEIRGPLPSPAARPTGILEVRGPLTAAAAAAIADDRRVDVGPPPGLDDRRHRDVGPTGRHRRPDGELPDGALGMTGIMRKLDAAAIAADARLRAAVDAETGRIPRVRD